MPRHKSLLKRITVRPAGKKRKCYHDPSHSISKGEVCLEIKERMDERGYCSACALLMLAEAQSDIGRLVEQIKTA